ncbi:MAG: chemotaxis response regulator protein-glutamate methylesterase [Betaproteobacteria bacterium HGW-Betaproteobacteria-14]|nr:MAG: chemotaxis response regulator protein-glutamate methylesterase [Betaproteobacteria bacterium HGW-Betaproteobacteria-14]
MRAPPPAAERALKTKVLIVDDSPMMRRLLSDIVNAAADMHVVGTAADPIVAHEMIKSLSPDVLTLDVEMPKMNGIEFLRRLMRFRPMPVVMVSAFTASGTEQTLKALELGAVDFVAKPGTNAKTGAADFAGDVRDKIRSARAAWAASSAPGAIERPLLAPPVIAATRPGWRPSAEDLVVIGASTGGTEALKSVLVALPENTPGILVVQHMPQSFTGSFAMRLDGLCRIRVKEAVHGERVLPGTAYVAPGHSHLLVKKSGAGYVTELSQAEPVNRHRPSVDVLFESAAVCAGRHAVGVILTGMGKDGAQGMLAMKRAGAWNIAQDQASCVVYGMPREAVALKAVDEVAPLAEIGHRLMSRLYMALRTT